MALKAARQGSDQETCLLPKQAGARTRDATRREEGEKGFLVRAQTCKESADLVLLPSGALDSEKQGMGSSSSSTSLELTVSS